MRRRVDRNRRYWPGTRHAQTHRHQAANRSELDDTDVCTSGTKQADYAGTVQPTPPIQGPKRRLPRYPYHTAHTLNRHRTQAIATGLACPTRYRPALAPTQHKHTNKSRACPALRLIGPKTRAPLKSRSSSENRHEQHRHRSNTHEYSARIVSTITPTSRSPPKKHNTPTNQPTRRDRHQHRKLGLNGRFHRFRHLELGTALQPPSKTRKNCLYTVRPGHV